MTAIRVIRIKMASTAACVTAKGGSVCVGANALRAATFTKLCTANTKRLKSRCAANAAPGERDVRLRVERMIAQGQHPYDRFFYVSWRH